MYLETCLRFRLMAVAVVGCYRFVALVGHAKGHGKGEHRSTMHAGPDRHRGAYGRAKTLLHRVT